MNSDPDVLSATAKRDAAKLDVERAIIRAPIDGVVTKRMVQVGQRVAQGNSIMTIVPLDKVYVEANFKERQLRRVKVGQPVKLTADIYGSGVEYHGKIAGFSGGTGSSFALIPAQNRDRELDQDRPARARKGDAGSQGTGRASTTRRPVHGGRGRCLGRLSAPWRRRNRLLS